jgi:hypothetical protein
MASLNAEEWFTSKFPLFLSVGFLMRLKSPTIHHATLMVRAMAERSARKDWVRAWSAGA